MAAEPGVDGIVHFGTSLDFPNVKAQRKRADGEPFALTRTLPPTLLHLTDRKRSSTAQPAEREALPHIRSDSSNKVTARLEFSS
jgi:hypothetical protein